MKRLDIIEGVAYLIGTVLLITCTYAVIITPQNYDNSLTNACKEKGYVAFSEARYTQGYCIDSDGIAHQILAECDIWNNCKIIAFIADQENKK